MDSDKVLKSGQDWLDIAWGHWNDGSHDATIEAALISIAVSLERIARIATEQNRRHP